MLISILQGNHTKVVEFLLKTPGVDVNVNSNNRWTPLHSAASVSYKHFLAYLVKL